MCVSGEIFIRVLVRLEPQRSDTATPKFVIGLMAQNELTVSLALTVLRCANGGVLSPYMPFGTKNARRRRHHA